MENNQPILSAKKLCKYFDTVKAVDGMDLSFYQGRVHTIIGENGSGKSTIAHVLAGILEKTSGEMTYKGQPYHPADRAHAAAMGICMLVQESGTISEMTVEENIFMGREGSFSKLGLVNRRAIAAETRKVLHMVDLDHIDPATLMKDISFEDRKLIEVGKALYAEPEVLIIDETTTALSARGRDVVYRSIRRYREEGKTVILISHILEEVTEFSDTVYVMRDGIYIGTLTREEGNITEDNMRRMMIGRDLAGHYYYDHAYHKPDAPTVLEVKNVSYGKMIHNVSFELKEGEILGIGGLTDCGMHELCKVVFGAITPATGTVNLTKSGERIRSTIEAVRHGIAYLSKNRDHESMLLTASIKDNIFLTAAAQNNRFGVISPKVARTVAQKQIDDLGIKASSMQQLCCELSGGNKQKVVVGKWLANHSEILLMDCPTRGIDIGVKAAIYRIMADLVKAGKSIIMVSEELPELIGMSDRILIMKDGQLTAEICHEEGVTEMMLIEKMV